MLAAKLALALGLAATPARAKLPETAEAPPLSAILERARAAPSSGPGAEARRAELDAYAAALRDTRVRGWPAWVIRVSPEASGATFALTLAAEDPYAAPVAAGKAAPVTAPAGKAAPAPAQPGPRLGARLTSRDRPAYLRLLGLPGPALADLRPGQKIYVDGVLREASLGGGIELTLEQARFKGAPEPALPDGARGEVRDLQISLERTACFGRCPVYKISAAGSLGQKGPGGAEGPAAAVTWTGRSYVGVTGTQRGQVSAAALRQLYAAILRADFFKLRDYESRVVTDRPGVIVTVRRGKEQKVVRHYLGDPSAPSRLEILESQIDDLLGSRTWISAAQ